MLKRWCVFCHSNIFYCRDFDTYDLALDFIRKFDLGCNYFIAESYLLPL